MSKWIRLRDTGTETALCVKEIRSDAIEADAKSAVLRGGQPARLPRGPAHGSGASRERSRASDTETVPSGREQVACSNTHSSTYAHEPECVFGPTMECPKAHSGSRKGLPEARRQRLSGWSEAISGGGDGNRTRVQGFAGPCLSHSATPPQERDRTRDQHAAESRLRADDGIRTRDPHLGKVMLYQLSHVRTVDPARRPDLSPSRCSPFRRRQNSTRSWRARKLGSACS